MTSSQIGIKGPDTQPGFVFCPYILATTTATVSMSDEYYQMLKKKSRNDVLNKVLDIEDEVEYDYGIKSRYSIAGTSSMASRYGYQSISNSPFTPNE
jgi:hypothetical protein